MFYEDVGSCPLRMSFLASHYCFFFVKGLHCLQVNSLVYLDGSWHLCVVWVQYFSIVFEVLPSYVEILGSNWFRVTRYCVLFGDLLG